MTRIPSKEEVLDWITSNPMQTSKRDIARAFGLKGADRIDLKRVLKELEAEGHLEKRRKTYRDPNQLPPVSVLQVKDPDEKSGLTWTIPSVTEQNASLTTTTNPSSIFLA